jgi:hypothetical protein
MSKGKGGRAARIRVENQGSIILLRPLNDAAEAWLDDNVQTEGWQWFGGALATEPRMVLPVLEGFVADGGEVR